MTNRPEALRWAAILEHQAQYDGQTDYKHKAADELRRLHAENEALREEVLAEREACAKVCDEKYEAVPKSDPYAEADGDYSELIYAGAAQDCADAIRARSEV